jgi:hypothetical protein
MALRFSPLIFFASFAPSRSNLFLPRRREEREEYTRDGKGAIYQLKLRKAVRQKRKSRISAALSCERFNQ